MGTLMMMMMRGRSERSGGEVGRWVDEGKGWGVCRKRAFCVDGRVVCDELLGDVIWCWQLGALGWVCGWES